MEKITEIINEWDTIELFPMAPKDEYIEEVKLIYEYLCATPKIQNLQLAEKINGIFIKRFGCDVYVAENPLDCVANGTGYVLDHMDTLKEVLQENNRTI